MAVGMSPRDAIGEPLGGPADLLGQCQILVPVLRAAKATPVRGPSATDHMVHEALNPDRRLPDASDRHE
jgi:hypothetical protein